MNFNWTSEILEDSKPFASALEIFRILQFIPCYVVSLWNNLNICQQLLRTDTWLITVGMLGIYCSILSLLQIITKHFTCTMPPPGMVSSVKKVPVCRVGGDRFIPQPDFRPGSLENQWFCYRWLWWVLWLILWKIMCPSPEPLSPSSKNNVSQGLL